MTNEQLQERCLEFAGFECYNAKLDIWLKPDGERTTPHLLDYPDFITSVDAHVRWTLPGIRSTRIDGFYVDFHQLYWAAEDDCHCFNIVLEDNSEYKGYGDTEALAICEAIWELTEKGND